MNDHGVYSGLSASHAAARQLDVVSNNVANLSTPGFRAGRVAFQAEVEGQYQKAQSALAVVTPVASDGPLIDSGRATDMALRGDGWFSVEGADGEVQLTRDGRFRVDESGLLVADDGAALLGTQGPIQLAVGEQVRVDGEGRVFGSLSGEIDQLQLLVGPATHLGGNRWTGTGELEPATPTVVQGSYEGSNVDPAQAMTELVEATRYFEAYQKAMQASDELTARLNQTGGR